MSCWDLTPVLTRNLFTTPQNPTKNTHTFSSPSPNPSSSLRFLSHQSPPKIKNSGFNRRFRCAIEYNTEQYERVAYPRPPEIPWSKDLCNAVHLIGVVGTPVQIKHLSSGKVLAWSRLAVKKSATDTVWISLTFWDELAHVAFEHVEKGQQVYVSGRLVSDTVEADDGKQQIYYKVVVQQLNFVEKSFSSGTVYDRDTNSITSGRKQNGTGSAEQLWQAFFANPVDWWDNRRNKRSPKYPDFKHKDTGEALWIEGRNNPPWVKSQLAILDSRMGSLQEQDSNRHVQFMSSDEFMPF